MNRFAVSLRRVSGAVYAVFSADDDLREWMQSKKHIPGQDSSELRQLIANLGRGWVQDLLINEDPSEASGVIGEALAATFQKFETEENLTRAEFCYKLTDNILNKGIRPINATAHKLIEPSHFRETLCTESIDPFNVTDAQAKALDEMVISAMTRRKPKNEVATIEICVKVKNAWTKAIEDVEVAKGHAAAKPMSEAVKEQIANMTGLDQKTVEAAMKKIKRACLRVEATEGREAVEAWITLHS